jgi:hypothetical protein
MKTINKLIHKKIFEMNIYVHNEQLVKNEQCKYIHIYAYTCTNILYMWMHRAHVHRYS